MTQSASAVVRAEVAAVEPGRVLGLDDAAGGGAIMYVSVFLKPSETLSASGELVTDSAGLVEVELGPVETDFDVESLAKQTVGDEVLAFLRLKGSVIPEVKNEEQPEELALGVYRVVSSQGLFLNSGGKAEPVLYAEDGFPATIEGESFSALVSDTQEAAS